jgi:hypothetical protein
VVWCRFSCRISNNFEKAELDVERQPRMTGSGAFANELGEEDTAGV